MERRDFIKNFTLTAGVAAPLAMAILPSLSEAASSKGAPATSAAMRELRDTIEGLEKQFNSRQWRLSANEHVQARRDMYHLLHHALETMIEADPARPAFKLYITPEKKLLGDNPDAVYYTAPVSAKYSYRVRGNLANADYTSFTTELGNADGGRPTGIGSSLNDTQFKAKRNGDYEIILSKEPQSGNWLKLDDDAGSLTTRHYYESNPSINNQRMHHVPITIEPLDGYPAPGPITDKKYAAGVRRVARFLRENMHNPRMTDHVPRWVSRKLNEFTAPEKDKSHDDIGFAARDNVYIQTNYLLKPDEALVMRGRFPKCRFANVVLWNHFIQTFDYVLSPVSLNRKQMKKSRNGSFTTVLAHRDPGVDNWLDTQGNATGAIFWRFLLPEGDIQPITTEIVPWSSIAKK